MDQLLQFSNSDTGIRMKQATIDAVVFGVTAFVAAIQPFLFGTIWLTAILLGKFLMSAESRRTSDFMRAFLIGAPLGVLAMMICQEHGLGQYTAIGVGALVSVCAERILKADWFRQLIDALIEALKNKIGS